MMKNYINSFPILWIELQKFCNTHSTLKRGNKDYTYLALQLAYDQFNNTKSSSKYMFENITLVNLL